MSLFKKKLEHKTPPDYNVDMPFDIMTGIGDVINGIIIDDEDDFDQLQEPTGPLVESSSVYRIKEWPHQK